MVLIVNEKHRNLIQKQFGSIIEFKKEVYRVCYFNKEMIKAFMEVLEVFVEKAIDIILDLLERVKPIFYNICDSLNEAWEQLKDYADFNLVVDFHGISFTFVKAYEKVPYGKYDVRKINYKKSFHCRNNC